MNIQKLEAMLAASPSRVSEFTFTVLSSWTLFGVVVLAAGFTDDWSPGQALIHLPTWLEFLIGAFITAGGVLSVAAFGPYHHFVSDRWQLEITGLILGGSGWFAFAVSALVLNPAQPLAYLTGFTMVVGATWRLRRTLLTASRTRKVKTVLDEEDE